MPGKKIKKNESVVFIIKGEIQFKKKERIERRIST
jgi:hypothetical protein